MVTRSTVVVPDSIAARRLRAESARAGIVGRRVARLSSLAAALAGGFARVVTDVDLRHALADLPTASLGSLGAIADLPGFTRAAAGTLSAAWEAGLDLSALAAAAGPRSRWAELAAIEAHVVTRLPPGALPVGRLVAAAREEVELAPRVLGDVVLERLDEVAPVYRPLLLDLSGVVRVTWRLPAAQRPAAWVPRGVHVEAAAEASGAVEAVECADPRHEGVEALRWVRRLLVDGVPPREIAIAAVSVEEHDAALHALVREANLPVHFAHGVPALTTFEGQAAAALADALVRGPNQERLRRFVNRARRVGAAELEALPADWARVLPRDATLDTLDTWRRALEAVPPDAWPATGPFDRLLLDVVESLSEGVMAAAAVGDRWLRGRTRDLWRRALDEGPPPAVEASLRRLRVDDERDPEASAVWAPAASLVGSPRRHVRLLGLTTGAWPRRSNEDPLLPGHVLDGIVLSERSRTRRDRDAFASIRAATAGTLTLSWSRRGPDGRRRSSSPLVQPWAAAVRSLRPRAPTAHAMSEADRRASRLGEVRADPVAAAAAATWRAWHVPQVTAHDGLVRSGHPAIVRATRRVHSATSLRLLLRDPRGFVAKYVLRWREPVLEDVPITLDPLAFGSLLHRVLEHAVVAAEREGGLARLAPTRLEALVHVAVDEVGAAWTIERPVPPPVLWRATLDEIRSLATLALQHDFGDFESVRSYVELPFGRGHRTDGGVGDEHPAGDEHRASDEHRAGDPEGDGAGVAYGDSPWAVGTPVALPGTDVEILGTIDRLDIAPDGKQARVIDYKSGRAQVASDLDEGRELQRALYASAVRSLLGAEVAVDPLLFYLRSGEVARLDDLEETLRRIADAVAEARRLLLAGWAACGPGAFEAYAEYALALPADAASGYRERKGEALAAPRRALDDLLGVNA
jgi:RecB family exonuclease